MTLVVYAAHLMPLFPRIGVNIDLLDAPYLVENLKNGAFETIQQAINKYEMKMFEYESKAHHDADAISRPIKASVIKLFSDNPIKKKDD